MTLRDELSVVRGGGILTAEVNSSDIPCIETSDNCRLCKHPLVSVKMITYNHEAYIARAIESVLFQVVDFEYEIIVGEDCSKDHTREICFGFQRKYPEKVRVLWSELNVGAESNVKRVSSRCRGEFVALCEGDDFWTDQRKLQKQVDIMRRYPSVGLCFGGARIVYEDSARTLEWNADRRLKPGYIPGRRFFLWHLFGMDLQRGTEGDPVTFLMTASVMMRRKIVDAVQSRYEILRWRLTLSDTTTWLAVSSVSDVYYLEDVVSTYFRNAGSILGTAGLRVGMDADLVRSYFALECLAIPFRSLPSKFRVDMLMRIARFQLATVGRLGRIRYYLRLARLPRMKDLVLSGWAWPIVVTSVLMTLNQEVVRWLVRMYVHVLPRHTATICGNNGENVR